MILIKSKENKEKHIDKKNIDKKILIASMIFLPYGLYLLYKNNKISLKILIPIFAMFFIIIFLSADIYKNPDRIYNNRANETFLNIDKNIQDIVGGFRKIYKIDSVNYKDKTYHVFSLTTKKGKYVVYMDSVDGKSYNIADIYEVYPNREHKYGDLTNDVLPEIINDFDKEKYGEIEKILETNNVDLITLKTATGEYSINITNNKISSIYKKENGAFNIIESKNTDLDLLPDIKKEFSTFKYGKIKKVIDYEFGEDYEVQYLLTKKAIYKVILKDDGSGSIFKSVD